MGSPSVQGTIHPPALGSRPQVELLSTHEQVLGGRSKRILADVLRISPGEAARRVKAGAQLAPRTTVTGQQVAPQLAATAKAWHSGALDGEHLRTIQRFVRELPDHVSPVEADDAEADGEEPAAEEEPARAVVQQAVPARAESKAEPTDRTDDPVRMYLREMGSVELLSREGEIAIAKRIEAGREAMIAGLCESPLTFQAIIIWRDELNEAKILLRDIIDLEATYAGPDAKKQGPVQTPAPYVPPKEEVKKKAEAKRAEAKRVAANVRRPSPDDEFGDVLSPEDFDKPQVEEEDDDEPGEWQGRDQPDEVEHHINPSTRRGRRR